MTATFLLSSSFTWIYTSSVTFVEECPNIREMSLISALNRILKNKYAPIVSPQSEQIQIGDNNSINNSFYQQMVSPNPSNPLEKIFLDNIKKGNLSVTNPTVVKVLRDHLQTLVGDYYLIE